MKLEAEKPLLYQEDNGSIRITGSRVLLEMVINQYQQGSSPEEIQKNFPIASLVGVYSAITYYLRNIEKVEQYIQHREEIAAQLQKEIESSMKPEVDEIKSRIELYTDKRVEEFKQENEDNLGRFKL